MRGKKISTALLLLAILATLAFIWGNSLDSAVESAAKSGRVRELLRPLLELVEASRTIWFESWPTSRSMPCWVRCCCC